MYLQFIFIIFMCILPYKKEACYLHENKNIRPYVNNMPQNVRLYSLLSPQLNSPSTLKIEYITSKRLDIISSKKYKSEIFDNKLQQIADR